MNKALITLSTILVAGAAFYLLSPQKPYAIAGVAFSVGGKIVGISIIESDGSSHLADWANPADVAAIDSIPQGNKALMAVPGPACAPSSKTY